MRIIIYSYIMFIILLYYIIILCSIYYSIHIYYVQDVLKVEGKHCKGSSGVCPQRSGAGRDGTS